MGKAIDLIVKAMNENMMRLFYFINANLMYQLFLLMLSKPHPQSNPSATE